MADASRHVWIDYINWRGERAWREIVPARLAFENSEWHPETQWILFGTDIAKGAERGFALADVRAWRATPPGAEGGSGDLVCCACGKPWDGETCGQKDNGWPHPVCQPITVVDGNQLVVSLKALPTPSPAEGIIDTVQDMAARVGMSFVADPEKVARLFPAPEPNIAQTRAEIIEECAKAIECDCCDACGESPEYENVCASELAARIRALISRPLPSKEKP